LFKAELRGLASDLPDNTRSKHLEQPRGYRHKQNQDCGLNDGAHTQVNHRRGVPGMAILRPRKTVMATASTANGNAASTKNHKNAEDMTFAVSQCIGRIRPAGIYRKRRKTK
jgi:hypothetical protein